MENRGKLKAMFIIPSAIGVILFMIPVKNAAGEWTVTVKIIADIIAGAIGGFLPILSVAIVTISAVMTLVAPTRGAASSMPSPAPIKAVSCSMI